VAIAYSWSIVHCRGAISRKKLGKEEVVKLLLESSESDVESSSKSSDFADARSDGIFMKVLHGWRKGLCPDVTGHDYAYQCPHREATSTVRRGHSVR